MNRAQLLNDNEEAMRLVLDGRQVGIWTALPGIINKVNFDEMTCEVRPTIQATIVDENGAEQAVNLPLLVDVPIVFPSGGGFIITTPLSVGDEVLVLFASRCIDAWWSLGGVQLPMEARMHDLSDGFAIPGPRSLPNVAGDISTTRLEVRSLDGDVVFGVDTKFALVNAATDLKTTLDDMVSAVNGFMQTIAALALLPPGTPILNTMIAPAGISAVAALAAVTTEIASLLEDT